MLLKYTLTVTAVCLVLAAIVALWRHHRELRDRRASVQNFDRWDAKGGPRRYRLPTFRDSRA